jgi:hypothetical protein
MRWIHSHSMGFNFLDRLLMGQWSIVEKWDFAAWPKEPVRPLASPAGGLDDTFHCQRAISRRR